MTGLRIGHGYDVHRLTEGRRLILGGVEVPYEKGLLGHSDADVLTHAVMDALLGAAALGDIGKLFPDTDAAYAGISSILLLERVAERLREAGYAVVNLDATVLAQAPKLAPYRERMRENLARAAGRFSASMVSVTYLRFTKPLLPRSYCICRMLDASTRISSSASPWASMPNRFPFLSSWRLLSVICTPMEGS